MFFMGWLKRRRQKKEALRLMQEHSTQIIERIGAVKAGKTVPCPKCGAPLSLGISPDGDGLMLRCANGHITDTWVE